LLRYEVPRNVYWYGAKHGRHCPSHAIGIYSSDWKSTLACAIERYAWRTIVVWFQISGVLLYRS
jgi:hypothetical protein